MWCQHVLLKLKTNNMAADFKKIPSSVSFAQGRALYCPENITHQLSQKVKEHLWNITLRVLDCSLRPLRVLIALTASLGLTKLTKP